MLLKSCIICFLLSQASTVWHKKKETETKIKEESNQMCLSSWLPSNQQSHNGPHWRIVEEFPNVITNSPVLLGCPLSPPSHKGVTYIAIHLLLQMICIKKQQTESMHWVNDSEYEPSHKRRCLKNLNIQKTKIMASSPNTSWQIDGETVETVADFIFLDFKITADGDCSHEIKRRLLLGRKLMTNLDSILKSRDITCQQSSI